MSIVVRARLGRSSRRVVLRLLALLLVALLQACAGRVMRVPDSFVPGLFSELLAGSALGASEDGAARFRQAWQELEDGDLQAARRDLEALRSAPPPELPEPGLYPVDTAIGAVRLTAGDQEGALRAFGQALERKPAYPDALVGTAAVAYLRGEDERSLDVLDRVLAIRPGHVGALALRGRVIRRLEDALLGEASAAEKAGDPRTALERVSRLTAIAPGDATLHKREAALAAGTGDFAHAARAYGEATRIDPGDVEAWLGLGEAHLRAGDADAARAAYETASRLPGGLERAQERVKALRERSRETAPPPGDTSAALAAVLDRGGLASLLLVRLPVLDRLDHARSPAIVTDVSGSRARGAIQDAVAAGVMEVYDNHTFRPDVPVNRGMLARTAAAVLQKYRRAGWLAEKRFDPRVIADVPPEHLAYRDVVEALRYGVMDLDATGAFRPGESVSGEEATAVLDRLGRLAR